MRIVKLKLVAAAVVMFVVCAFETKAADDTFVPATNISAKAENTTAPKTTETSSTKAADASVKSEPVKDTEKSSKKAAEKKTEEKSSSWSSKSGAELWAQDCRQCHNIRDPKTLSPVQWENAMSFMRFRCNLTAKEYRKIADFLQAASR
jgi:hypothetical protein